jgi:hypothetical protein
MGSRQWQVTKVARKRKVWPEAIVIISMLKRLLFVGKQHRIQQENKCEGRAKAKAV